MNKRNRHLTVATFIAAAVVAALLVACLAWMVSASRFITCPEVPELAAPIGKRYCQFLQTVLLRTPFLLLGVGTVAVAAWRRSRLQCVVFSIVLLHYVLVCHIAFVLINSTFGG